MKQMFETKPELILIRGIPGSGKSTLARKLFPNHALCEADQYFIDPITLKYSFNPKLLPKAHAFCLVKAKQFLYVFNRDTVVANTFIKHFHMQPYLDLGFPTTIIIANGNFESIHNVPKQTILRMKKEFEL